jgi:hypothetical protein
MVLREQTELMVQVVQMELQVLTEPMVQVELTEHQGLTEQMVRQVLMELAELMVPTEQWNEWNVRHQRYFRN